MSELKSGDSTEFKIGDKTLTVEPIPYGQMKRILRMVMDVSTEFAKGETKYIPDVLDKYLPQIFPLIFIKGRYPFIDETWIEDNLTIPVGRSIFEAAIAVNGLKDFFGRAFGGNLNRVTPSTETPLTPPEKDGSTTSSGSPTDGGPKT